MPRKSKRNSNKYNKYNKRRRRRNNKYSSRMNVPVLSRKPITMGYGTTKVNVTSQQSLAVNGTTTVLISNILANSSEFNLRISEFMYFKINYVKIIIMPSLVEMSGAGQFLYINFNWVNNNDLSADQIKNSDNTKIVSAIQLSPKVLTYIPPNIMFNGGSVYNPKCFMSTQATNYPGFIHFYNMIQNKVIRIEVNVIFRGARDFDIPTTVNNLNNLLKRREEEIKEEEKEGKEEEIKEEKLNEIVKEEEEFEIEKMDEEVEKLRKKMKKIMKRIKILEGEDQKIKEEIEKKENKKKEVEKEIEKELKEEDEL